MQISPGIPKKPETADVAKLMGTWIPYRLPAAFKKNNNNAPITNFIAAWPRNRAGLNWAPVNNNIRMSSPRIEITKIGSKKAIPFLKSLYLQHMYKL